MITTDIRTSERPDALIAQLELEGVATSGAALLALAETARTRGVSEVLVSIMIDRQAPIAPRVRAFGRVSSQVACVSDRSLVAA